MENTEQSPAPAQTSLIAAWACFVAGRLDDAIELARQAIKEAPEEQAHAEAALGWFLLSAGSVPEAESILTSALGRYPDHAPLHWYLGLVLIRQGRREEACQALVTAVTNDPELDEAAATLAWVLGDLGRFSEAVFYCREALAKNPHADRQAQLGWLLLCLEQWEEAASHLAAALLLEPHRKDTRSQLASAQRQLDHSDEALRVLADGLVISPDATDLLHQQTHLLLDLKRTEDARAACGRLLKLQPRDGVTWYLLALALVQSKRPGVAARALARARRLSPERAEIWSQTAWLALETGDLGTACDAVEHVLALAPDDPANSVLAAVVMEATGNVEAASDHAERAVARAKQSAVAWRALAQVRSRQGRWAEAEEALTNALGSDPKNSCDTYRQLGWLYLATHSPEAAVPAFTQAVANSPQDAASWCGLAEAFRATGKLEDALDAVRKAQLLRRDWTTALTVHGHILMDSGPNHFHEAVLVLTRALLLRPAETETRSLLSNVLHRLGKDAEALNVLAEGLAHAPAATDLIHQQFHLLLNLGRTKDARATCHRLLRQQPLVGIHWHLLASVLVQQKRRGVAVRALYRGLRLAPESIEMWRQLAWLSLEAGKFATAKQALHHVLALAPQDPASDILAAVVLDACGNPTSASEHAERAVARAPQSAPAWRALAQVRARQGSNDAAKRALHTALSLDPIATSETYRQLGWVCRAETHYDDAVAAFNAAITNNPKDASSWYGLAEVYRAQGRFAEAMLAIKPTLTLREEWSDRQLRGQILHEQIYYYLQKKWSDLGGTAQAPFVEPALHQSQVCAAVEDLSARTEVLGRDTPARPGTTEKYEYVVCSLSTKSHAPLMSTLAHSVRQHFSGRIYLLVVDSDDSSLIPEGTTLVRLGDVIAPAVWQDMVGRYNILELCCALKSFLMRFLARTVGCPIIYLDADTYLLEPLDALLPARPDFSVLLTPHLLRPFSGDLHAEEIGMLCVGVYNGGMIGVGVGSDAIPFLDWWLDRVSRYAYDSREQGVFTDQKWLDLVPCFFKGVHISHAPGLNLGHWRVCSEKDFSLDAAGKLIFCGESITLLHMSGFKSNRPDLLAQHLRPPVIQDSPLGHFLQRYALEVIQNRH